MHSLSTILQITGPRARFPAVSSLAKSRVLP